MYQLALLSFYLCHFRRHESVKRLIVYDQKIRSKLKKNAYHMLRLTHKELKTVAKIRKVKGYKRMSEDELLKALIDSMSAFNNSSS